MILMGLFDKVFGSNKSCGKGDKNAKILLGRSSNSYSPGDDKIFSKISDEVLICEVWCHTEITYLPRQFHKLTPDLLLLVADFAGNTNVRNDAGSYAYDILYDKEKERYVFDKDIIINAIKQFDDIGALQRVRSRASSKCPPFPHINNNEIYAEINAVADERIKELTE